MRVKRMRWSYVIKMTRRGTEIGSENEEEEYEEHEEDDEILYLDDHGITLNAATRSGRNSFSSLLL